LFLVFAVLSAQAAVRVDPGAEPSDVEAQYREFAASKGRSGDRAELVCRPFAEGVDLCFTHLNGGTRLYYTKADGKDAAALEASGRGDATAALAGLEATAVEGFTRKYWLRALGDGRDHVPALFPEALQEKVGKDVVIAVPARGVFVAWEPGDADFDKVVAVGVRRMFETLPDPVSPLIYAWNGTSWSTWGQAKAVREPTTPAPATPVGLAPGGATTTDGAASDPPVAMPPDTDGPAGRLRRESGGSP
jgi:hypothetical protein